MQFLSVLEFSKSPKVALSSLSKSGKVVLTNNGKPSAFLIKTDSMNFEKTLALLQQIEFMQTVADMQMQSAKNGNSKMSLKEINKEIANARKSN
jgi:PHD/YefM family antitoxin component YafN of YafNO toxin-antitoxin module